MASSTIVLLIISIVVLLLIGSLNIDAAIGIKHIDKDNSDWQLAYKYTVAASIVTFTVAAFLLGVAIFTGYKTKGVSSSVYTWLFSIALVMCLVSTILTIIAAAKIKHGDTSAGKGRKGFCNATSGSVYTKLVAGSMCGAFMMAMLFMGIVISRSDATDRLSGVVKNLKSKLDSVKNALKDPNISKNDAAFIAEQSTSTDNGQYSDNV